VPVSYVQDDENLNFCGFLELKVNKWEINTESRECGRFEPYIRCKISKAGAAETSRASFDFSSLLGAGCETYIVLESDEDAGEVDNMLLLRLVAVLSRAGKAYVLRDRLNEMSEDELRAVPTKSVVLTRLMEGK
jgi:hypothetical protein